jgi:hypothetical protein
MGAGDKGSVRREAVGRSDGHRVQRFGDRRHSSSKSDRRHPVWSRRMAAYAVVVPPSAGSGLTGVAAL